MHSYIIMPTEMQKDYKKRVLYIPPLGQCGCWLTNGDVLHSKDVLHLTEYSQDYENET